MFQKLTMYLGIILSLAVLIIATLYLTIWRGINEPVQEESTEVNFIIEPGQGVKTIGANLADIGLIRRSVYFYWYVAFKRIDKKLQAGGYLLNKNMNLRAIAKKLAGGEVTEKEKTIKIIEGWNIKQIADYLEKNNIVAAPDFIKLTKPAPGTCFALASCQVSFLAEIPAGATLEGYLFPDTYRVFKDTTAEDIIAKMLKNFDAKLTPAMRADIKAQGKNLQDIIIMASILEKEARTQEDMKIVADIFWKRLKSGVALESDATLSYILNDNVAAHSAEDLAVDSAYNTYKYRGLPPGPIDNPGLNAILAAIYPTPTDYFYFLHNVKTGKIYFAKTFTEHKRNKELYLNN
ncbi:MAG: endolytic transglycosylase MltG [Patescibacteria group bacterium]